MLKATEALKNARTDAVKAIVFVSDGDPTFYYDQNGKTKGKGSSYDETAMSNAQNALKDITSIQHFFMVGVGPSENYTKLNNLITDGNGNSYVAKGVNAPNVFDGTSESTLKSAFSSIEAQITQIAAKKITISDTLSENVEFVKNASSAVDSLDVRVYHTKDDGSEELVTGKAISNEKTFSDGKNTNVEIKAEIESGNKIKVSFNPADYELQPGYRYEVCVNVKPTKTAYEKYLGTDSKSYPDTPGSGTGTHADANELGYFSNTTATASYSYQFGSGDEQNKSQTYRMPVVQLSLGTLEVTKTFEGLTDDQIKALIDSKSLKVTLVSKDYQVTEQTGQKSYYTVSQEIEKTGEGSDTKYVAKFTDLPAGEYEIAETGETVTNYNCTPTFSGDSIESETTTQGDQTITKQIVTVTGNNQTTSVSLRNTYTPSTTTVTIKKKVVGTYVSSEKSFHFTAAFSGGSPVDYKKSTDTTATMVDTDHPGTSFDLKNAESITYTVPIGTTLTLNENDAADFTVTYEGKNSADTAVGTTTNNGYSVTVNDATTVTVTNTSKITTTGVRTDGTAGMMAIFMGLGMMGLMSAGYVVVRRKRW